MDGLLCCCWCHACIFVDMSSPAAFPHSVRPSRHDAFALLIPVNQNATEVLRSRVNRSLLVDPRIYGALVSPTGKHRRGYVAKLDCSMLLGQEYLRFGSSTWATITMPSTRGIASNHFSIRVSAEGLSIEPSAGARVAIRHPNTQKFKTVSPQLPQLLPNGSQIRLGSTPKYVFTLRIANLPDFKTLLERSRTQGTIASRRSSNAALPAPAKRSPLLHDLAEARCSCPSAFQRSDMACSSSPSDSAPSSIAA